MGNDNKKAAGKRQPQKAPRDAKAGTTLLSSLWQSASSLPLTFIVFLASIAFIFMVSLPALVSIERNETLLNRFLSEKGSSLIDAVENSMRIGIRTNSPLRLQSLMEEMIRSQDIAFIAVTMPDGTIIAHSNPARIGKRLSVDGESASLATMHRFSPQGTERWGVMNIEDVRSFVVYRQFRVPPQAAQGGVPLPMIFLGLQITPLVHTLDQNRAYVIMLMGIIIVVGLICLLAYYFAERARQSRVLQILAENRVLALEEEVRRKEKLAAVGTLAAGVAHEIRNPLSSIKGYATYFGQLFPEGSENRSAARVMVQEVERLNKVITELIGLSRPTDVTLKQVSAADVLSHVSRLISQSAKARKVAVELSTGEGDWTVTADPDRLGQALLNLCLNALDAMPDGGELELALLRDDGRICIAVRDTGTGISEQNLRHIFDPYFTTKAKGTGIGLATVHKIVEALKGEITVSSRLACAEKPGETVFRIWLPAAGSGQAAPQTPSASPTQDNIKA